MQLENALFARFIGKMSASINYYPSLSREQLDFRDTPQTLLGYIVNDLYDHRTTIIPVKVLLAEAKATESRDLAHEAEWKLIDGKIAELKKTVDAEEVVEISDRCFEGNGMVMNRHSFSIKNETKWPLTLAKVRYSGQPLPGRNDIASGTLALEFKPPLLPGSVSDSFEYAAGRGGLVAMQDACKISYKVIEVESVGRGPSVAVDRSEWQLAKQRLDMLIAKRPEVANYVDGFISWLRSIH